ncbi:hypothetical protein GCM10007938_08130 [Vibrio zhanjiangensis]|uniref:Uncharacterized protein n=1 Tax=Vibrio zhanjiangensis TaxID=1046128 RepID=A0ABQ6EWF2_9VIBR|nr:hypothetical protein [Vibrio zhanjiangensis]GLT17036.1 hypothetical protein GCM10007938_08130 [Vibrio zhanjiangensis]
MSIRDSMRAIEQQIYIACSEGDYDTVQMLEYQLESLRSQTEHPLDDDSYAPEESKISPEDLWY